MARDEPDGDEQRRADALAPIGFAEKIRASTGAGAG
jgi:hypothetical protein